MSLAPGAPPQSVARRAGWQLRLHLTRRSARLWVRLALGFAALLLMIGVVVVLAVLQFRSLAAHGERLIQHDMQRMLRMQRVVQHAQGHGGAMARLLTAPRTERERLYPAIDAEYETVDRLLEDIAGQTTDAGEQRLLADLVGRRSAYREVFAEVVVWIESEAAESARLMFNQQGQPALRALLDASLSLLEYESAALRARQHEAQLQIRQSEWLLAALAAGALALCVLLAWRTNASVVQPLARIEGAAHRIAGGDYGARVRVRGGDELGQVAQAINAMAAAVAARESEIERLAYTDRLTGLPSRTALLRESADLMASNPAALLMDVARLRTVNEVLGFDTGDAVLCQVADRLRAATASRGEGAPRLARLAGGVFVLVCPQARPEAMDALRAHIDEVMVTPVACDGHVVDVQLVHGLSMAGEGAARSLDGLLRCAELALGEAKRAKRRFAWHAAVDGTARARQLSLLSSLRSAAMRGELEMWLQPKQCLKTGQTPGLEGLVRWRHPDRGYVSPADFVPFAERTGHIGVVTEAMLDLALAALARWRPTMPGLRIAVNVSALDIQDAAFPALVEHIARRHDAPLQRLCLEITESSLMDDADRALPVLNALRAMGVLLSIDDFGTGYSSLAYLKRLPVSELKIDRSFVAGADRQDEARALLRTIIDLGHSLGLQVTAEGVERREELSLLAELGCDLAQGYLIGRPLAPPAAAQFVLALAPAEAEAELC